MTRDELLRKAREAVQAVEPGAKIILYGSRARHSSAPDADWDLMVILPGTVGTARKNAVRHQLFALELTSGEVISSIVRSQEEWDRPLWQATPLYKAVRREGVVL